MHEQPLTYAYDEQSIEAIVHLCDLNGTDSCSMIIESTEDHSDDCLLITNHLVPYFEFRGFLNYTADDVRKFIHFRLPGRRPQFFHNHSYVVFDERSASDGNTVVVSWLSHQSDLEHPTRMTKNEYERCSNG